MQPALLSHGRTPQIVITGTENMCDDNDLRLHDRVWTNRARVFFLLLSVDTTKENAIATKFCTFRKCMQTQKYI